MTTSYNITLDQDQDILKVGFNPDQPADGNTIVADAHKLINTIDLPGGKLIRINGAASLGVAMVIAHKVCHLYGAVAVWDPRLQGYIVVISHSPDHRVGDVI